VDEQGRPAGADDGAADDRAAADAVAASDGSSGSQSSPPGFFARVLEAWRNPAYRFVLLFLVYLLTAAILYPPFTENFPAVVFQMMTVTADIECWILGWFSDKVTCNENLVSFIGFPVKIIVECTGIYEILIFGAAVLAFPTSWSKRAIGLLFGVPLLYLFNVVRIIVLILVGKYWSEIFDFMHIYFWQATLILMITSVWLLWIFKVVRDDESAAALRS
jgi:archaeosortase B (VPXXXP-CTERM-specific)